MDASKGKRAFINSLAKSLEMEFNSVCPEISLVAKRYLGVNSSKTAQRYALECRLPVPAFRIGSTRTSTYHVNVYDIAELIYERYCYAKRDYKNLNS